MIHHPPRRALRVQPPLSARGSMHPLDSDSGSMQLQMHMDANAALPRLPSSGCEPAPRRGLTSD